jgi:hypothetical protein
MIKFVLGPAGLLILLLVGGCSPTYVVSTPQVYNPVDSIQAYTQRSNKVTLSAGDDQEVNTRIQEVDPWPRYVGNKQIVGNGERMAGAVDRYRDVSKLKSAPQPLPTQSTSSTSTGGT